MSYYQKQCRCEIGDDCTKTTVCALNNAVDEAMEQRDMGDELRDTVVEAAKMFVNAELAAHHGPYEWARKEARQILFEAVDALEIAEKNL